MITKFKLFENSIFKYDEDNRNNDENIYYFDTSDGWEYKVSFHKKQIDFDRSNSEIFYIGFKSKKAEEYFHDDKVITNSVDFYKVARTIIDIIKQHYNKYKPLQYIFTATNKGTEDYKEEFIKTKAYKKYLNQYFPTWKIEHDSENINRLNIYTN